MRQVRAEHRHGVAVRAQRLQADRFRARAQIGQEVINVGGAPLPRKFTRKALKTLQQLAALLDGLSREATRQHLRPPAIEHGSENPFISPEQPNVRIHQHPRDETWTGTTHNDP